MPSHTKIIFLLVFFTVFGHSGDGFASACQKTYEVAINDFAPLFYRDADQVAHGVAHELVLALQKKTGCKFTENEMSHTRAITLLNTGQIDILLYVAKNSEYERGGTFIPLAGSVRSLVVRKEKLKSGEFKISPYVKDSSIIFGNTIGSKLALTPGEDKALLTKQRLREFVDLETEFQALGNNKIQALIVTPLVSDYYLKKFHLEDKAEELVDMSTSIQTGIYLSKKRISSSEQVLFEKAMKDIKDENILAKILEGYMSPEKVKKYVLP